MLRIGEQWTNPFHRSGWRFALESLRDLHDARGVRLVGYVEEVFAWHAPEQREPILEPWVGFLHNPPNVPDVFGHRQAPAEILHSRAWRRSERWCAGVFTLSRYLAEWLEPRIKAPVEALIHPTETPAARFSLERYRANPAPAVVHVGWWLRRFPSFYELPLRRLRKVLLDAGEPRMRRIHDKQVPEKAGSVEQRSWLERDDYDRLLCENLVFMDLYDSSANNALIECIVRETPVLVNPLPSVVEYLGLDYPFYFASIKEAARKAESEECVAAAHAYLQALPKDQYAADFFRQSMIESKIYQSLDGAHTALPRRRKRWLGF